MTVELEQQTAELAEETPMTYMVWIAVPIPRGANMRPWSLIAKGLTEEQARVYRDTCVFDVSVQPERIEEE